MTKPASLIIISTASIIFAGCINQTTQPTARAPETTLSEQVTPAPTIQTTAYTLAEVATHATPEDCWLVIENTVYNVSDFASNHPGGAAIYAGCGLDATTLFNTRPGGSKTPHSDNARSLLPTYAIGSLSQY